MGFMGVSCICDSDNAADMAMTIAGSISKIVNEAIKTNSGSYNTPGEISFALIIEEMGLHTKYVCGISDSDSLRATAKIALQKLEDESRMEGLSPALKAGWTRLTEVMRDFLKQGDR